MFLYANEILIKPPVYDTLLAAMMTMKSKTEFRTLSDSGLKTLVPQLLKVELPKFEDVTAGKYFDELNPEDYETIRYSCADSDYALQLYKLFNSWFDNNLPKHRQIIETIESPTAVFVGIMKYHGVKVDKVLIRILIISGLRFIISLFTLVNKSTLRFPDIPRLRNSYLPGSSTPNFAAISVG